MANKDYYSILGVSKNASDEDIKKAYRQKAREHHPDVAKNKEEAEKKFKEINEAYQVLGNKQKRQQYDQFGSAGVNNGAGQNPFGGGFGNGQTYTYTWGGGGQNPFGEGFDPFDIFEEVFGFRGYGRQRAPQKGKNLYYSLQISFVESIKGVKKRIRVGKEEFDVKIPAGVNTGTELKLEGKGGEAPQKDLPRGDLFLGIEVIDDPNFARQGSDIYTLQNIKLTTAVLGGSEKVKVVDPQSNSGFSEVTLKIPSGTQSGTNFRIKGKGMPSLRTNSRGDHFVRVKVTIPQKLNKKQKQLFESLQNEGV